MGEHNHFETRGEWDVKRITPPAGDHLGYPLRYDAICTCGAVIVALKTAEPDTSDNWSIKSVSQAGGIPYDPQTPEML